MNKKAIFSTLILLTIIISTLLVILYDNFFAERIACKCISSFEDACFSDDSIAVLKKTYDNYSFSRMLKENGTAKFIELLTRFEKGFEMQRTYAGKLEMADRKDKLKFIGIELSKTDKTDNKKRLFDEIIIVKDNRTWKVLRYYFPDLMDY